MWKVPKSNATAMSITWSMKGKLYVHRGQTELLRKMKVWSVALQPSLATLVLNSPKTQILELDPCCPTQDMTLHLHVLEQSPLLFQTPGYIRCCDGTGHTTYRIHDYNHLNLFYLALFYYNACLYNKQTNNLTLCHTNIIKRFNTVNTTAIQSTWS